MLKFKEFVPRAPEYGTIRVDHGFGCDGSSSALRIERTRDKSIKAYCFRCNNSGFYTTRETKLNNIRERFTPAVPTDKELKQKNFALPQHLTSTLIKYSNEALQWLNACKIKPSEIKEHHILFNPNANRLVLPVYRENELVFFQYRKLVEDGYPKYISFKKYEDKAFGDFIHKGTNAVVIVEDKLSAIKCCRAKNKSAFAILGSFISDEDLVTLLNTYTEFFIYLDNDSRQVKVTQGKLLNLFKLLNRKVHLIKHQYDPKYLNAKELNTLFTEKVNVI